MNAKAMITIVIEAPTYNLDEVIKRQNPTTETQLLMVQFLNKIGDVLTKNNIK